MEKPGFWALLALLFGGGANGSVLWQRRWNWQAIQLLRPVWNTGQRPTSPRRAFWRNPRPLVRLQCFWARAYYKCRYRPPGRALPSVQFTGAESRPQAAAHRRAAPGARRLADVRTTFEICATTATIKRDAQRSHRHPAARRRAAPKKKTARL